MSTFEDFENAPVGATATNGLGNRAMKVQENWILQHGAQGVDVSDEEMVERGYTLDSPAPTTAREALALAWELAHPVKPGQVIPAGTRYLRLRDGEIHAYTAMLKFTINAKVVPLVRTLDPLQDPEPDWSEYATLVRTVEPSPEPKPDWLDAPAVLASLDGWHRDQRVVFLPTDSNDRWVRPGTGSTFHWSELREVTPLYPLNEGTLNGTTAPLPKGQDA